MSATGPKKMWGGRFERAPDKAFYEFERSLRFDRRLLPYELALDRAWARALAAAGILTADESEGISKALVQIERRAIAEPAWLDSSTAEDIHHFVEAALVERLGPLGAMLHTGRSRNEMVATEFRMFVKDAAREMRKCVALLIASLLSQAEKGFGIPMPGMTHLQHAQPVLLSHWLLAHAEALFRDLASLAAASANADSCPLGSGALAGCAFPLDRRSLASELGFSRITANSLDAVGDRDFALGYLFALAVLGVHLSRLSEDFILFATPEFGFVELPEEFSTGSSLMPQKKNPDGWELIRGKAGRITGALVSLLMTLKGVPSSYVRDLQEDKEPVFEAHDQALAMVKVAAGAVAAIRFREARLREAAADGSLLSTEAADYLVARGVPFREAHEIVGQVIREAEREGKDFQELPLDRLKTFSQAFGPDFTQALTLEAALERCKVPGGTAPEAVRAALTDFQSRFRHLEEKR